MPLLIPSDVRQGAGPLFPCGFLGFKMPSLSSRTASCRFYAMLESVEIGPANTAFSGNIQWLV